MSSPTLRLLSSRNFGIIWWSGFLSDAGSWMQAVALGALVTELTDSAGWGSLTAAATFLMTGLMTPFGGALADQHNRRRMMICVSIVQAILTTTLAVVYSTGHTTPLFIVIVVALEGALIGLWIPVRGSLILTLVTREELVRASAMGSASWNLGRAIGPLIAGVIMATGSYSWIFVANAATFVLIAAAVLFVRVGPDQRPKDTAGPIARMKDGARVIWAEPGCRLALLIIATVALTVSPFIALVPAVAQIAFDGTPVDTAHFTVAQGVGAVLGGFGLGMFVDRFGQRQMMRAIVPVLCLAELAYATVPDKFAAMALLVVVGFCYSTLMVGLNAVIQLRADPAYRGRAISLFFTSLSLFYPIGATVQGWLSDIFGVRQVLATGAGTMLVISLVVLVVRPHLYEVLGPPEDLKAEPQVDASTASEKVATSAEA